MSQWLNEQRGERASIDTFPQALVALGFAEMAE